MATHDYVIANQNGANFRSDLNNVLQAIISNNSSATEPSTTSAYMWWADTANDKLKMRNGADSAWIDVMQISTGNPLFTGDLNLGDGDKINFGDSNDLQIYHNGNQSYIRDTGTGNLYIEAGTQLNLRSYPNQETFISCNENGAVNVYYDNSLKLATTSTGIDVTGGVQSQNNAATNDATVGKYSFYNTNASASANPERAYIEAGRENSAWGAYLKFGTSTGTSATTERMRIDSSGNLLVGTTGVTYGERLKVVKNGSSANLAMFHFNGTEDRSSIISRHDRSSGSTLATHILFQNASGSQCGVINCTGSSTSYGTSSDYRLKENIVDMEGAIDRVKALQPRRFNFIADADTTVDGFIAHEVSDVVPEAISGEKDATKEEEYEVTPAVLDDDGNVTTEAVMGTRTVPDYQGIDQSKLVPLLTGALQEAIAKIESLEARITALEA